MVPSRHESSTVTWIGSCTPSASNSNRRLGSAHTPGGSGTPMRTGSSCRRTPSGPGSTRCVKPTVILLSGEPALICAGESGEKLREDLDAQLRDPAVLGDVMVDVTLPRKGARSP